MIAVASFDVGTGTAINVVPALHVSQDVRLHNHAHGNSHYVYVGGSSVDSTDGFDVAAGEYVSLVVPAGESLWAISSHNTVEFHVVRVSK